MTPDAINGIFELAASVLLAMNVIKLHHDKRLRGVCVAPFVFMVAWGYWNCFFYLTLGAWWSFWGGVLIAMVNTTWVSQMVYYTIKKRGKDDNSQYDLYSSCCD